MTASALTRLFICRASGTLPKIDVPSKWRGRGTSIHRFRDLVGSGLATAAALLQIPKEHHKACEDLPPDDLPDSTRREVAYAYNLATGKARVLEGCRDRDYSSYGILATDICGTLDAEYIDDMLTVLDYKSGAGRAHMPNTDPTMLFYGLCAWDVAGRPELMRLVFRNTDTGRDYSSIVDAFDLMNFSVQLRAVVDDADEYLAIGKTPRPVEGLHCQYCNSEGSCPAKVELARKFESGEMASIWAEPITAESAPGRYKLLQMMRLAVKRAEGMIEAWGEDHTIPIGDGKVYGAHEKRGNLKIDGGVAHGVLTEMMGGDAADAACPRTMSQRAMRAVVMARVAKGKGAGAVREVMKAIDDAGGSDRESAIKIEEYTPRSD